MTFIERWTAFLLAISDGVDSFMAAVEAIVVSVVGRLATWAALAPSAVMVARSASLRFDLDMWLSLCVAGAMETVGVAAAGQWLQAREWNAMHKKSKNHANDRLMLVLFVAYFIIVEAMIAAFEFPHALSTGDWWGFTAMLLPGLSLIAIIVMNERIVHRIRTQKSLESLDNHSRTLDGHIVAGMLRAYQENPYARNTEVSASLGVHPNTVSVYRKRLQANGSIRINGRGVEVL